LAKPSQRNPWLHAWRTDAIGQNGTSFVANVGILSSAFTRWQNIYRAPHRYAATQLTCQRSSASTPPTLRWGHWTDARRSFSCKTPRTDRRSVFQSWIRAFTAYFGVGR